MRVARVVGVVGVARVARVVGVVGVARVARVARVVGVVGVGGVGGVVVEASSTTTMDRGRRSARPETGRVWDGAKNGVISPLARILEIKIEQFGPKRVPTDIQSHKSQVFESTILQNHLKFEANREKNRLISCRFVGQTVILIVAMCVDTQPELNSLVLKRGLW